MKSLAYIATFYCIAAAMAGCVAGWLIAAELVSAYRQMPAAERELAERKQEAASINLTYLELRSRQRAERAAYSAAEAINMSYQVQQAHDQLNSANAAMRAAAERRDALQELITQRQLWFVPLGALLLLHLLGIAFFWPWRERKAKKPRR